MTDATPTALEKIMRVLEPSRQYLGPITEPLAIALAHVMGAHAAQAVAEERERCRGVIEGANFLEQVEKEWLVVHLRAGPPGQEQG